MPISIKCDCGKALEVGDDAAGQQVRCPSCGRSIRMPAKTDGQIGKGEPRPLPRPAPISHANYDDEPPDSDISTLRTHAGKRIPDDADFFVPAPPEIGRLWSAWSSLAKNQPIAKVMPRVIGAGAAGFGVFALLVLLAQAILLFEILPLDRAIAQEVASWAIVIPIFVGAGVSLSVFFGMRPVHTCSYVGREGVAVFQCSGKRDRITRKEIFLFRDAMELRIGQIRHYTLGIYRGTVYSFAWIDEAGQVVYQFRGGHKSSAGTPGPDDAYHFMLMAEHAWTMCLMRQLDGPNPRPVTFHLQGPDYLRLSPGLLTMSLNGQLIDLDRDEIDEITLTDGILSIREVGAKEGWFSSDGVHRFMAHDLGNSRFFMFAMEKLLGIRP